MKMKFLVLMVLACGLPGYATTIAGLPGGTITNGSLTFSNFAVSTVGGLNTATSINGVTFGVNTTVVPDTNTINVSQNGAGIQFDTGIVPPCTWGSFCVSGKDQSLTVTITYLVTSPGDFIWVDLYGSLHSHANTTTAVAYLDTCGSGVSASCAADPTGVSALGTLNGNNISIDGPVYLGVAATNRIWVRQTIYLATNNGNGSDAEFLAQGPVAAPEPATLGMMGLGLASLAALKLRRKRAS